MKTYKFSDGTSYADNIQRCSKGEKRTRGKYTMKETQKIIEKYGSDNVISVVPHWNGGAGKYHGVLVNKLSNGVRDDSLRLAECIVSEVKVVKNNKTDYTDMPDGMMNGTVSVRNLGESNTDGAPQLKCACVLTENWFADYPKNCPWDNEDAYNTKKDNKFVSGRGWLESKKGIETIAQAHAKGIKRYIDTLKS